MALSLLCLMVAVMNSTKSLGPVMAIGVVVAFAVMSTLFPALLVSCGRWIFWPVRPHYGTPDATSGRGRRWTGRLIAARPRLVWMFTATALAVLALGAFGLHSNGLQNQDMFRNHPEAVAGEKTLLAHFPGGTGDPLQIVGPATAADRLFALAKVSGVVNVSVPATHEDIAYLEATPTAPTASTAAFDTVDRLRTAVHSVPGARVGGGSAVALDTLRASHRDQSVVVPLVLAIVALVMCQLLRAVVAPLLVLATTVLSLGAAFGVSALVFDHAFGFAGTDTAFPLWTFVFLVSLGIDYSIFLMARIREEARAHGTAAGALIAARTTGGTITAAGLVLAGTFAALLTLPLVMVTEIGFAVACGVLLDTFVVRTVLVTALTVDLGDCIWWPGRSRAARPARSIEEPVKL
ncbi:MAG: hypothetical protein JWN03_2535 [Nocardia sp.]|nr:hypothetical protein [Nocardia sp.]